MRKFWEKSSEWQHKEICQLAYEAAHEAEAHAGQLVLSAVLLEAMAGGIWRSRTSNYINAVEAKEKAFSELFKAEKAFEASRMGRAYYRYKNDPLGQAAGEQKGNLHV